MTYEELKAIAKPHIRENSELPSNSFLLLTQLHIPFKTQKQCEEDYKGKMTPLYNHPAFLAIDTEGNKVVYFNSKTRYWNFYIFHEIAHYVLGHENDSPQNEIDADLLGCILAAPVENLPSNIKSARDLSVMGQIPIDKAEVYWNEIKHHIFKTKFSTKHKIFICSIIAIIILFFSIVGFMLVQTHPNYNKTLSATQAPITYTPTPTENTTQNQDVIVTISGTKYHMSDCRYVKNKTNIIEEDINTAINNGYTPCKVCIK